MNNLLYSLVKLFVKTGLHCYHKQIKVYGLENIPKDKPVMFLPNHQSALIDVLLIATDCNRKPYFLTRADVFSGTFLNRIFSFFRMLPIFRMRDGRNTLSNNNLIFDKCAALLNSQNALVLFPEANHNLKRRVRTLSKGFTRIILRAFELNPQLDIQIVPVGLNYKHAENYPDEVAIFYGTPVSAKSLYDPTDNKASSLAIKEMVSARLKDLTVHVPEVLDYDVAISKLKKDNVNFLNPNKVNTLLKTYVDQGVELVSETEASYNNNSVLRYLLCKLNIPVVLFWRLIVKPKVPEAEFMGTFRFATGLILFPIYLILILVVFGVSFGFVTALTVVTLLIVVNLVLVKYLIR